MNGWENSPVPLRPREAGGRAGLWGARAIMVASVTVLVMMPSALAAWGFVEMAQESPMRSDGPGIALLMLPFICCFGFPFAVMGAMFAVLPTLAGAAWAGLRVTGRESWWWVPVAAGAWAVVVALGVTLLTGSGPGTWLWVWLSCAVGLSLVALVARRSMPRPRPFWRLAGCGLLAMAAVVALGSGMYASGLAKEYTPAKTHASDLVGTWHDGRGGTLSLDERGRAVATRTWGEPLGRDSAGRRCEGTGTWTYEPDDNLWNQTVDIDAGDCWPGGWTVGGTADRLKLNYEYGDPDSPDWYVLIR
ncbi:hypothetical protein [Streptomyces sp. CB03238]|uniref:hypothetical protein n=1 Tax=Streptomyces sp. CB03238 TaxID=1907777 RepID=UPI000A11A476|nr:hypothetical protein [Streptomyces sp. CB03238]ORT56605.1 hypothetical protein BKD26_27765 [Streptomyces sp. CB03238]